MGKTTDQTKPMKEVHRRQTKKPQKPDKPRSWSAMKSLFKFGQHHQVSKQPQTQKRNQKLEEEKKDQETQTQTHKQKPKEQRTDQETRIQKQKQKQKLQETAVQENGKRFKKMRCSGSLCSNTNVMHRPETSLSSTETTKKTRSSSIKASSSNRSMKASLSVNSSSSSSSSVGLGGSFRGMPFRRFYGCYECRTVIDPSLRTTICSCPDCGEIFMNDQDLELHQAVRHAVSELVAEDTSKNIVEIIFQSSWLEKHTPICKIDRILKVHNTQTTISKFEEYRDSIKSKSTKKDPRCLADGNELLRFHCTTVSCPLGFHGSTTLCTSTRICCRVCGIIKNGFKHDQRKGKMGILTTATSGRAHDSGGGGEGKRAMLLCRVIAGRVRNRETNNCGVEISNDENAGEEYDSVAGEAGAYSNLDELYVFNPKAILPCFVVIYSA